MFQNQNKRTVSLATIKKLFIFMLCKVLYHDRCFNAAFYCGRPEAVANVSEWMLAGLFP